MMKSLIAGIAAFVAMGIFAGGAYAYDKPAIQTAKTERAAPPTAKSSPIQDCVHVMFPQCGNSD